MQNIDLTLVESISKYTSIDTEKFLQSQNDPPHVSIKLNHNKLKHISELDFEVNEPVPWAQHAYYLNSRPAFYADPLFYSGAYYVMDSSSMFLEYILNILQIPRHSIIIDIAAAPGGKSVLISNYLNEEGLLWSNEINFNRAKILQYNLSKWGKTNYIITNNDTKAFKDTHEKADVIVCDAPCSGSGLFRKYPEWKKSFNENMINQCVSKQKQILQNIFDALKTNGYLIYSTCSFTSEENEEISEFIIHHGFQYINISIPDNYNLLKTNLGIRFFPHLTKSEGFFYAVFQKKQTHSDKNKKNEKYNQMNSITPVVQNDIPQKHLFHIQNFHQIYQFKKKYFLSTKKIKDILNNDFNYITIGTLIADNQSAHPSPYSAYSLYLNEKSKKIHLNKNQALKFLKKENIHIHADKDIYLFSYKNLALAWGKVLESRVNNYFPNEWRILKDIEER